MRLQEDAGPVVRGLYTAGLAGLYRCTEPVILAGAEAVLAEAGVQVGASLLRDG